MMYALIVGRLGQNIQVKDSSSDCSGKALFSVPRGEVELRLHLMKGMTSLQVFYLKVLCNANASIKSNLKKLELSWPAVIMRQCQVKSTSEMFLKHPLIPVLGQPCGHCSKHWTG